MPRGPISLGGCVPKPRRTTGLGLHWRQSDQDASGWTAVTPRIEASQ